MAQYYHHSDITKLDDLAARICIIVSTRPIKVRLKSLAYKAYDVWAQSNRVTMAYKFESLDTLNTCNFWKSYYLSCLCTLYILILLARMSLFFSLTINPLLSTWSVKPYFKLSLLQHFTFMSLRSSFETPIDIVMHMHIFNSGPHCRTWEHKRRVIPFIFVSPWTGYSTV